jgi:hypothetical protein
MTTSSSIGFFLFQQNLMFYRCLLNLLLMLNAYFSCKLKVIQTDGGGEFRVLIPYLSKLGISHRMPCPYTRQQ